jgi:DNA-binding MltR family transcriptional regulator
MTRKIIPIKQLSEETRQLFDVLNDQSDLACVLIGTAFLDAALGALIAGKLSESSVSDKLLGPSGALGTFNARTDIAYCLRLITKKRYQDLCVISYIRNQFAHSHMQLSFNELQITTLCNQLHEWRVVFEDKPNINAKSDEIHARARNQFKLSVIFIANWLLLEALALKEKNTA